MENVIISRAKISQAAKINRLIKNVISSSPYYSKEAIRKELERFSTAELKKYISKPSEYLTLVANFDKEIIGFRIAMIDADLLLLDWTGVSKKYRGRGIGKKIHEYTFDYVKKHYKFIHKVYCDTRTTNKESISLLRKMGFKKIATLKNHWYKHDYYLWEKLID